MEISIQCPKTNGIQVSISYCVISPQKYHGVVVSHSSTLSLFGVLLAILSHLSHPCPSLEIGTSCPVCVEHLLIYQTVGRSNLMRLDGFVIWKVNLTDLVSTSRYFIPLEQSS